MIRHLIKKDFLLVKKSIVTFLGISIIVPLIVIFLMETSSPIEGIQMIVFLYMLILLELSFMQAVATEEEKSPKAIALLCAAPYSRKEYIISKYACYLIFYAGCLILYSIIAAVYPKLNFLSISEALIVFLAGSLVYGIYTPIALKYGITKARTVFTLVILLISMGPTIIVNVFHPDMHGLLSLLNASSVLTALVFGVLGICTFLLSTIVSVKIFIGKEL